MTLNWKNCGILNGDVITLVLSRALRRRLLFMTLVLLGAAAATLLMHRGTTMEPALKRGDRMIEEEAWVGFDSKSLASRLGSPTNSFPKYVQVGPDRRTSMPPGPYLTWRYERNDGTLYVWFYRVNGVFISFDSLWFDRGVKL